MTPKERIEGKFRVEEDALGEVEVLADHLWGAQTERSHLNFPIGVERYRWGRPVIRALGILKTCAALTNEELGQLPPEKVDLIVRAAQKVIDGKPASSQVRVARCNGLENTFAKLTPRSRSLDLRALRSPRSVSGRAVSPVCWPESDHAVSPCRAR